MNNQMPYWMQNYCVPPSSVNAQYNNFQSPSIPNQNGMIRPGMIYGRVVNDPNEITPNEIPMDGSVSLFPTSDYSKIYAKAWNGNGLITTKTFVLEDTVDNQVNAQGSENFQTEVKNRLDKIEKILSRSQHKPRYHNNNSQINNCDKTSSSQKGGSVNE